MVGSYVVGFGTVGEAEVGFSDGLPVDGASVAMDGDGFEVGIGVGFFKLGENDGGNVGGLELGVIVGSEETANGGNVGAYEVGAGTEGTDEGCSDEGAEVRGHVGFEVEGRKVGVYDGLCVAGAPVEGVLDGEYVMDGIGEGRIVGSIVGIGVGR